MTSESYDLVIHNGTAVTVNDRFDIFKSALITVQDGVITSVGSREPGQAVPEAIEVIDADENTTYESTIRILLRNEIGFDISNMTIWINGTCENVMNTTGEIAKTALANKEEGFFGFGCQNLTGIDIDEELSVQFTNTDTGNVHRKVGYIKINQ